MPTAWLGRGMVVPNWMGRERPLNSALMPRSGSCQTILVPSSRPKPVSASPPSWRILTSREGRMEASLGKGTGRVTAGVMRGGICHR